MKLSEFVKSYLGKKTDWDGVYGIQCVDLIDAYIEKVLELRIGFFGNAKYWWTNRKKSAWLKSNFDFIIPKYKNGDLKAGDIGVRTSGKWGHIFIVKEPTKNGMIKYYDQNATGNGDAMTLRSRSYSRKTVNGILRPKAQNKIGNAQAPAFKAGRTYTLTTAVNVRTGPGTDYKRKKRTQLTADGRKNAQLGYYAVLKKGTRVTVLEVRNNLNDIWVKIPSGWICLYYDFKKYAK